MASRPGGVIVAYPPITAGQGYLHVGTALHRDFWRLLTWVLMLSALFWGALVVRSCDGRPGPADIDPQAITTERPLAQEPP
jgi:hypothetical protein